MTTHNSSFPESMPDPIARAFSTVWKLHHKEIEKLRLTRIDAGAFLDSVGVVIRCDDPKVDPAELLRVFRLLESEVSLLAAQNGSDQDITFMLQSPGSMPRLSAEMR